MPRASSTGMPLDRAFATTLLARLAPRAGLSLGALQSGRVDEFRVLLASAAMALDEGAGFTEREVNDRLQRWLDDAGAMVATDHVELRRWLVDMGLLVRDGFGRRYERNPSPPAAYAEAIDALRGVDAAALVAKARDEDRERRDARRAAYAPKGAS